MKRNLTKPRVHFIRLSLIMMMMFLCFSVHAQKKVVGYVPTNTPVSMINFTRITHLNIAFENPDAAGNLSYSGGNDALIQAAHANNVKVLVSICGGGASEDAVMRARYFNLINATNRAAFISKIVAYLNAHNFDGIDLDLEGGAINADYSPFTIALNNALPAGKLLTAALSHTNNGNAVSSAAIQALDFLNVMSYDYGWGQATHHSTYEFAVESAKWWVDFKGIVPANVIVGVPFYGYTNTTGAGGISFNSILNNNGAAAANQDTWNSAAGIIYYNGIPTIRRKTQMVLDQNYGGIMIWQLAQDATGTNSLLYHIDQLIKGGCTVPAQPGVITGNTSVASGSSQTYSIAAVANATSYTWTLPSGWSGSSTSTTITTTAGATGGTISVRANNSCGSSATRTLAVTVTCAVPVQPGAIAGNTTVTSGSNQTYSIAAVSSATSYTWTLPSGWSGTSTSTSITTIPGAAGGVISVRANNACGAGTARTLTVTVACSTAPAQPNSITGTTSVAAGSSQTYSVAAVSGATSYTWTLPSGWSGTSTLTSITATAGSAGGTISVSANNACGSSAARTLAVTIFVPTPNLALNKMTTVSSIEPGTTFAGANAVDGNLATRWSSNYVDPSWIYVDLAASYDVNRVKITWEAAYSTAYVVQISADAVSWSPMKTVTGNATLVNDWTGLTGTGRYVRIYSTARNSQWGNSIFELEVYGTNACTAPAQPAAIAGNTSVTSGSSQTYTIAAVANATSYTWTLPSGWSGTSATTSITATAGTTGGTISVRANNTCGASTARTLAVTVTCNAPAQPGAISGNTTVAAGSSQTYSVAAVSGATSYTWTLPSGWSGTSTSASMTTTAGSTGGTISVRANNTCGASTASTLAVTVTCTVPSQPGAITGNTSVASGSSQTYSVAAVSGATSYSWTLPSGWSGTSTTASITATAGASGTISVIANNSCGASIARTLAVTVTVSSNLALNKPVTVSSIEPGTIFSGANAVDGNLSTRWSSNYVDPSWIYVDLAASYDVNRVKITWEAAYSTAYVVQISADAVSWSPMKTVTGNATLVNDWTGLTGTGRYVRIYSTARNSQWGNSIFELEVYGTSGCTLPTQPSVISGNPTVASGSSQTYSIAAVSGATSYTWTLPSGWSGTSTSTSISATAGTTGGTISVRANNTCGASTARTLAVTVTVSSSQSPYGGTAWAIPGTIQAENYDLGGQGIAFNDMTAANQGTAYRTDAVDVETNTDNGGGFNVGYVVAGEWLEYTVNVTTAGSYQLDLRVAATTSGKTFHVEMAGINISGAITVPNTGGWDIWQTVTVTNLSLSAGQKIMRIVFDAADMNLNYVTFSATPATPMASQQVAPESILTVSTNPFVSATKVGVLVKEEGEVSVKVYDLSGYLVRTISEGNFPAGAYQFEFDAAGLKNDIYIIQCITPTGVSSTRVMKVE